LNTEAAGTILKESRKRGKGADMAAYLYALLNANTKTIREVLEMADKELTLDEVLEEAGLTAKWEKRGEKTGWEKAIELLKQGYTVEQLEQMSPSAHPAS
jgi:hypothetical protein